MGVPCTPRPLMPRMYLLLNSLFMLFQTLVGKRSSSPPEKLPSRVNTPNAGSRGRSVLVGASKCAEVMLTIPSPNLLRNSFIPQRSYQRIAAGGLSLMLNLFTVIPAKGLREAVLSCPTVFPFNAPRATDVF